MADAKRLYVQNPDEWQSELSKKRFFDDELEVKVIERGIVLPARKVNGVWEGGVCDNDFNFMAGYCRRKGGGGWSFNRIESAYVVDREEILQLDEDVIYGGLLMNHFGHFMMECLGRLWYVLQNPETKSKIVFITTAGYRSWFEEFLNLMGIESERVIYVDKPLQFRSVTVPEQSQYSRNRIMKEFFLPYKAIKARVTPGESKKLYLTRTEYDTEKHNGVRCFNEKYFEDFFTARGFESVSMEKLSLEEQVSLIMGADEIAANLGTLTHWAAFCKPNAKFIMINRTNNFVSIVQCLVNTLFNVDYYIVDGSKNFLYADRTNGVCMFGSNKYWKKFVADYFGERIAEDDDNLYFEEALDEYLTCWSKKYSSSKEQLVGSLKDLCNRIVTLEKKLNEDRPLLSYQTHVSMKGWGEWKSENQFSNSVDQRSDIQAIKIKFSAPFYEVYYSVYYNEAEGWSEEVSTGQTAGTVGKAKSIRGIKIELDDLGANEFDIFYRVHILGGSWSTWAKNGEQIFSNVPNAKLNSIQIKLEAKNE